MRPYDVPACAGCAALTLFDLYHQGRAFVILRDPIERVASMYYHRAKTLANLDGAITIEDSAMMDTSTAAAVGGA